MRHTRSIALVLLLGLWAAPGTDAEQAREITAAGRPAQLDIRAAGEASVRVTLRPLDFTPRSACVR
jgi:hypothetical protein